MKFIYIFLASDCKTSTLSRNARDSVKALRAHARGCGRAGEMLMT